MNVWLIIANPYAYDFALERAIAQAQSYQTGLRVVFFIRASSVNEMIHGLSEMGWFGGVSLRTIQSSMSKGYRELAIEVLKRVQRKAKPLEPNIEGVVEAPSLELYVEEVLLRGAVKVIVAGSKSLSFKLEGRLKGWPEAVEYIEEE